MSETSQHQNSSNKPQSFEKKKENIVQISMIQRYIDDMDDKTKMKFWIKTLLSSYKFFPEIISTIDKIIDLQATSLSFYADVYNMNRSSLKEYEKVIDLSERKNNIINIYLMTKKLMDGLSYEDLDIIEKKFIDGWNSEEIASELGISKRTVFRKINRILYEIYLKCKQDKWTVRLIESQTKSESWLQDKYIKLVTENYKNSNFKSTSYTADYSKSSSELYVGNLG